MFNILKPISNRRYRNFRIQISSSSGDRKREAWKDNLPLIQFLTITNFVNQSELQEILSNLEIQYQRRVIGVNNYLAQLEANSEDASPYWHILLSKPQAR